MKHVFFIQVFNREVPFLVSLSRTHTLNGHSHDMWGTAMWWTSFKTLPAGLSLWCRPPVGQPLAAICIPLEPREGCGAERMKKENPLCSPQSHPVLFNYRAQSINFMLLTQWEHIKLYWIKGHRGSISHWLVQTEDSGQRWSVTVLNSCVGKTYCQTLSFRVHSLTLGDLFLIRTAKTNAAEHLYSLKQKKSRSCTQVFIVSWPLVKFFVCAWKLYAIRQKAADGIRGHRFLRPHFMTSISAVGDIPKN